MRGYSNIFALVVAATMGTGVMAGPFDAANIVDDAALAAIAGRADIWMAAQAEHAAMVADNQIIGDSTTGEIRIDDNAFQNMSGLAVLNSNTGNNVAINASIQVNVALNPAQ